MTPEHYKSLLLKIEIALDEKRAAELNRIDEIINEERQRLVESVKAIWTLDNGSEPPPEYECGNERLIQNGSAVTATLREIDENGRINRADAIRKVVRQFESGSIVTSHEIIEKLKSQFPHFAEELASRKTVIAKVLRSMARRGEIQKIRSGKGTQPTVYKKN